SNPLVRHLVGAFQRSLEELLDRAEPASLLDVGCGEGALVQRFAQRLGSRRVVGVDLREDSLQAGWSRHEAPNLEYRTLDSGELAEARAPFPWTMLLVRL